MTNLTLGEFASSYIPDSQVELLGSWTDQDSMTTDRTSAERETWSELIDELLQLRSLDDDWDGQGALAPSPALVDSAIGLACQLRDARMLPAHYALAGVNGTIRIEWIWDDGSVDIEVIEPGLAEACEVDLLGNPPSVTTLRW